MPAIGAGAAALRQKAAPAPFLMDGSSPIACRSLQKSYLGRVLGQAMADSKPGGTKLPADIAGMSFEEALAELQELVKRLERGDNKLDEAINAYERGAALKQHCEAKLKEAQLKVEKIVLGADGKPQAVPANID